MRRKGGWGSTTSIYIFEVGGLWGGTVLAKWFLDGGNASASGGARPVPAPGGDKEGVRWTPRMKASRSFSTFRCYASKVSKTRFLFFSGSCWSWEGIGSSPCARPRNAQRDVSTQHVDDG
jgi:hypothetical protein